MVPIRDEFAISTVEITRRLAATGRWSSLLIMLTLAACSAPETPSAGQQGPAQTAPGGVLDLAAEDVSGVQDVNDVERLVAEFERVAGERLGVHRVRDTEVDALVLVVDQRQFEPALAAFDGDRGRGISAVDALREDGARVVVGSSFVSQINSLVPVGLLRVSGRDINGIQAHGYRRVIGTRPDGLSVVGHRAYHANMFDSALQAGPGVVEEGLLDITERDLQRTRYLRGFVATCGDHALAGVSLIPVHLFSLGQALLQFSETERLGCDEVVNLAGDREAVLGVSNGAEAAFYGNPLTAKVALVTFLERTAQDR